MLNLLKALRQDEHGVILSTEIVIIGSLLVIGLITGLTCLQTSVNGELQDLGCAVGSLDQSYSFPGYNKSGNFGRCCAYTAGSAFYDSTPCDDRCGDILGCEGTCIVPVSTCGTCDTVCNSPVVEECGPVCGICGGQEGGCNSCEFGLMTGPICIDTGVPGMKVTEWPASDFPVEPCDESQMVPLVPQFGPPMVPQFDAPMGPPFNPQYGPQVSPQINPQFGPLEPPGLPFQPRHSIEPPSMPFPYGYPAPPASQHQRGRAQFRFPEYVW